MRKKAVKKVLNIAKKQGVSTKSGMRKLKSWYAQLPHTEKAKHA
jgi:hypothetical protein